MADTFQEVLQIVFEQLGAEEAEKLQKALTAVGSAGAETDARLAPLVRQLEDLQSTSAKVAQAIDISAKIDANNAALEQAKKALADLNAEYDRTDKSSVEVNVAFEQAEKRVRSLSTEQLKLQSAAAASAASLKASGVSTNDLSAAQQTLRARMASVAQQITGVASSTKSLGVESGKSANLLTVLADNLGKIITVAAAVKLALKGVGLAKDAFSEASQVEDQLARIQALAATTQQQFAALSPAIERAAESVNVSSQEAAAGLAALVEQGQSVDEAMQSLVPTLQLAKIAQIDVAQAAGIVDDALDRFGLSTSQAGEVVDVLVTASRGAKDGLTGIAGAMQQIAPLARSLGLSFKDTAGILGTLQQNGMDAGSAVRGLRSIFTELQDPASKLRANLAGLGDTGSDFATAIDTLARSGSDGERALLDLDGGARTLATFLVQQGVGAIQRFSDGLNNAQGAASRTVATINNTAGGAFKQFENALDDLGVKLAAPFFEPVRDELQKLAREVNEFSKSAEFDAIRDELVGMAKDGVEAFDRLVHGIDWKSFISGATDAVTGVATDLHTLTADIDAVVTALSKVGAAITALKNIGDIGIDLGKSIFGSTSKRAIEAALAVSKAKDAIKGSTSDTTRALESMAAAASKVTSGAFADLRTDAGEAAAAIQKLGSTTSDTDFSGIESGIGSTADKIDDLGLKALSVPPKLEAIGTALKNAQAAGQPAIAGLDDAIRRLGTTQSDLATAAKQAGTDLDAIWQGFLAGKTSIEDVRAEFAKYADAQRASVANSEQWKKDTVEQELEVKAATLGISDAFEKLGDARIRSPDFSPATRGLGDVKREIGDAAEAFDESQNRAAEAANEISGAMGNALSALAAYASSFAAHSQEAVSQFFSVTREFFEGAGSFTQAALTDGTGILRYGEAVEQAGKLIQSRIDEQRQGVAALAAQWQGLDDAALNAKASAGKNLDQLAESLRGDAAAARDGRSAFDLLGAADLSPLASALDAAAAKVDALKEKAVEAKQQLEDMTSSLQDQIDQLRGDDVSIENRRFETQLEQIKDLAEESGTLNSREYDDAVKRAKELHDLKLKQIADEKRAAGGGDDTTTATTTSTTTARGGGSGAPSPAGGVIGTIKLDLGNGRTVAVTGNQQTAADLRRFIDELKRAAASSGLGGRVFQNG